MPLPQAKGPEWSPSQFLQLAGRWLAASAVLALGLGWAFIQLFKSHSHAMTRATVYSQVLVRASGGLGRQCWRPCTWKRRRGLRQLIHPRLTPTAC